MSKTGLIKIPSKKKEWENILGWGTLTNPDKSTEDARP